MANKESWTAGLERELRNSIANWRGEIRDLEELLDDPGPEAIKVLFDWRGAVSVEDKIAELQADIDAAAAQLEEWGSSVKEAKPRRALIVTGNAYVDRDDEIIKQAAFEAMVDSCWKDGSFETGHDLLFWHRGDPIGRVVWADTFGPFLVEVAEELPDARINVADPSDPPKITTVKEMWDIIERGADWGASYEFFFQPEDAADKAFDEIIKTETSVLPRGMAANGFTLCEVIR